MASFYRYETTDITLSFLPDDVLMNYDHIVVSLSQVGGIQIDKTEDDLEIDDTAGVIDFSLSQEETSQFTSGNKVKIQVNIYYADETRNVSTMGEIEVLDNLYKKVMSSEQ
jgi:hypothetical protein